MSDKQTSPGKRAWQDVDDLKARTDIRDVLAGYGLIESMRSRGTALLGPSPFYEGGGLSFRVDLKRGIWNDFQGRPEGCKGNVVGLVQALEGCPFPRALQIVAERFAGQTRTSLEQTLPATAPEPTQTPPTGRPAKPRVSGRSRARSRKQAPSSRAPAPEGGGQSPGDGEHEGDPELFGKELRGLRYDVPLLAERGISPAIAQAYGVGYCSRGLMKSRLAAPVRTPEGQIAGYVGRSLKPAPRDALWKNPAGFARSHYLFGLHRTLDSAAGRKAVKDYGLVVTQSPLDVLRLVESGFANAVALMSASMSRRQLELLVDPTLNPTRRITLLMDNDEAGQTGKREVASKLIHVAFVRYACWKALETEHTSPDRLDDEQLRQVLSLRHNLS